MKHLNTIRKVSRKLRKEAEKEFGKGFSKRFLDLAGYCCIVSRPLFRELRRRGIPCQLTWNSLHCFVTYENHVIDLTATQFGVRSKVCIKPIEVMVKQGPSFWEPRWKTGSVALLFKKVGYANSKWTLGPLRGSDAKWERNVSEVLKNVR